MTWHREEFLRLVADKVTLPHALLVRGPRGIGKLAFARALAQALLCEISQEGGTACERCTACAWMEAGTHPDYRQIEPAAFSEAHTEEGARKDENKSESITVEQIRTLPDFISMSSHRAGRKIVLVHPAEMLNLSAANALLKSLEEPSAGTCFILVTHRPFRLLPTIKSRCRQLGLVAPNAVEATRWLATQGLRDPALALAYTANAPLLAVELEKSEYWAARAAFLRNLTSPDLEVLAIAEAARECAVACVLDWLQKWSYDIAYYGVTGRVRYNADHASSIEKLACDAGPFAAVRFHRQLVKLQAVVHHPLNARLFVEDLLFGYRDAVRAAPVAA